MTNIDLNQKFMFVREFGSTWITSASKINSIQDQDHLDSQFFKGDLQDAVIYAWVVLDRYV